MTITLHIVLLFLAFLMFLGAAFQVNIRGIKLEWVAFALITLSLFL